jgi:hypothetical protein
MTKNLLFSFLFLIFSTTVFAQWPTYCTPTATNQANYGCGIANLSIGSLTNRSQPFNYVNKFYYDSTGSSFKTTPGATVNVSTTNGNSNGGKTAIFVDWNRDGVYANPAELVWQNSNTAPNAVNTGSFVVPALQSPGAYRVRFFGDISFGSPNPCFLQYTGNMIDYTMIVSAPISTDGQILTLNTPSRFLTGNNTISLKMANTGSSNITSLSIGYKYGNNSPVTQTISSLNVAGLYDATFSTPLNLSPGSDSLKVWIANINGNPSTTQGNDTLRFLVTTCNPLSGTYTIDPAGSGPTNFTTFTNAMNTLWCGGVTGPVTFNVAAGTYVEQISVQEIIGSSATNTITINGGTGNAASRILSFNFPSGAASPNFSVFHLNGADFFRIKNLTIRSTSPTVGYGFLLNNQANSNIIDSCIIDLNAVTSTTQNNSAGINFSGANNNVTTTGNHGSFNTIQNTSIIGSASGGAYRGINNSGHGTSNTASSNQNNSFINNTITNFWETGIYIYGANNTIIRGNSISRPARTSSTTLYGIYTQYCNNVITDANRIFNPFGGQLTSGNQFFGIRHSYNYAGPNTFTNNAIYNINGMGTHYGIYSEGNYSWNAKYYNNTISLDFATAKTNNNSDFGIWISFNTSSLLHDIKNNIITLRRSGSSSAALRYGIWFNDYYNNTITNSNNNLILVNAPVGNNTFVRYNSIEYKSLAAWKASNSNLFDQNSISLDPTYTNLVSDVTPAGCGLNNLGVTLADVTTDINGVTRPSNPDMGAIEFNETPQANEGALMEFSPVTTTFCSGGLNATAVFKNNGTNPITSANFDWSVNATPQTQYVWTGSLAPGASTNVTLGIANFNANATNSISATIAQINGGADACASNNNLAVSATAAMSGVYTIGGAVGPTNFTTFALATAALGSRGVCGPVTINVVAGTYNTQVVIPFINGSSSINTVTFNGAGAATTIITTGSAYHAVRLDGTQWVRLRNLTIRSSSSTSWPLHIFNGSSNVRVSNCIIECTNTITSQTSTNYLPVLITNGNSTFSATSIDNSINMINIDIDSNVINGGWHGLSIYGNSNAGTNIGIRVRGNTFNNAGLNGIFTQYVTGLEISGNTINMRVLNGVSATASGINLSTGTLSSITTPLNVLNNRILNSTQFGIILNGSGSSASLQRARIINNAIGGGFVNAAPVGISITSSTHIDIYHNSVNIDNAATTAPASAISFLTGAATFCDVRNNHFAITNAGASNGLCFRSPAGATFNGINHNNYFKQGAIASTTIAVWNGANVAQSAIATNLGAQSVATSPTFTSATNLLPTSGTINGALLFSVPSDINNAIRNNPPDIGAFEVPNTNTLDLAVLSITSPDTTLPLGSHNVIAQIYNFGATTVTNFNLKHTVNNLNLQDTAITGISLAQNQSMLVNMGPLKQATFPISQNTLRVFVDNINGGADDDAANDLLVVGPRWPALCGTFTINGTPGPNNFTTFANALTALANGGICGPIVFNVAAGTYTGQLDIPVIRGASATNTVRFVGASMATCSLTFATAASTNNWHILRFNGSSFVSFERFTIRSTTTAGWLVHFLNGTDNRIRNCRVEFSAASPSSGNYVNVLINGSNSSMSTTTSIANNHVIDSCEINNGYYGIEVRMANSVNRFFATNSVFNNIWLYAIDINSNGSGHASKIINNRINMSSPGTTSSVGLYFINASANTANNQTEVNNNIILNAKNYGIRFQSSTGGTPSAYGTIYNNMIGGGFSMPNNPTGIDISNSSYFNVYHNTINVDGNATASTAAALYVNGGSFINIQNNHLAVTSTSFAGAPLVSNSNTNITFLNNNNYFNNAGSNLVVSPSGSFTNANFKTAYPNGGGAASINTNPSFVSNTNLRVTNGCNKGANLNAILPLDVDGTTRNTPADIGAYEVTGLPNNDLGVSASINPSFPVSAGSQNIKVVVKNFGSNAVTSANISYRIGLNPPVTVAWTGSVQACDTFHFTFPVPITINPYTPYSFKMYTSSPNAASDPTASNDTFSANYCSAMSGVYTIAPAGDFTTFNSAINALLCGGIAGPVTFNVSANTFTEKVSIPAISGTSAINTITFNGVNTASTILQYATTSTVNDRSVLQFNNSQFISFRNMTIRSTSASYAWTAHFLNGTSNRLVSCAIESPSGNPGSGNFIQVLLNGDASSSGTNSSSANNHQIDSCTIGTAFYGVQVQNSNGLNTTFVRNNNINQSHQSGFYSSSANSTFKIIGNNINIRSTGGTTSSYGIFFQFCTPSSTNFHEISNNTILNAGQYGIYADYTFGSGTSDPNFRGRMFNNMIGGGFRNTTFSTGIYVRYDYWNIFHNSVNMDVNASGAGAALDIVENRTGYDIRNNIFAVTATSASSTVPVRSLSTTAGIFNNNIYFNATNSNLLVTPSGTFTASNFKAAYPTGGGAASINANPSFVSNTNLRVTNACNKGANLNAFAPLDIDGSTRSTSPDIGAHEVQGIASNDIGVSALYTPGLPASAGSQTVRAVLKNFGSNTITSANVSYILNNGTPVTQSWSGSLLACDTIHIAFPVPINLVIGNSYAFKLYSSAPNATTDPNAGNDTFNIQVCPALNGTYTVGPTGDFASLSSAINTLVCGGMSGPVRLNVQSGTYTDQFLLPAITGLNSSNQLTIQSLSGNANDVTIGFNATGTANNYVVRFTGASYVKFRNITLQANNASFGRVVDIASNGHYDSFINVRFVGQTTTSNTTNLSLVGSYLDYKYDFWYFANCQFINSAYGTYMQGSGNNNESLISRGLTLINNTYTNQYVRAIHNNQINGFKILNNTITTNSALTSYMAMYNYWIYIFQDQDRPIITGNRISGATAGHGIYCDYIGVNSNPSASRRLLIANNMIQLGIGNTSCYGIRIISDYGSDVLYNSVNLTNTQTSSSSAAIYLQSISSNTCNVINNSFVGSNGAPSMRWDGSANFTPVNYNNHYTFNGGTNFLAYLSTTPYTTIATWRSNTSNRDLNSVSVNPLYTSSTDLHSNSSGLNNAGIVTAVVITDIDGQSRCPNGGCPGGAATPDIGADEFLPVALDASISAINAPTSICPGGAAANVLVSLKNIGVTTLNTANIQWSVNGVTQTPFSYTGPSLATGQETNNINIGSFSFVGLNNTIKVWSAAPNGGVDGNNTNDTLSSNPGAQLNGVYTIGGASPNFASFSAAVSSLNTLGVCGPVTFNVRQGTYNEKLQINAISGASANNFVTFRADPANTNPVVLTDNTNTSGATNHTVFFNGTSFVQFRDMTITNTTVGSFSSVLRFEGTQDSIVIKKNILSNGLISSSSSNYAVVNHATGAANMIRRFVLDSNTITGGSTGVYLYGNQSSPGTVAGFEANNRIRHNTFNNNYYYGIFTYLQRNHEIIGNTIDMGASTDLNSIGVYMIYIDSFKLERNNIKRFGANGVFGQILNNQFGTGNYTSTIVNNIIGGINTNSSAYGINFSSTTPTTRNINIFHNSVSINSTNNCFYVQTSGTTQFANINIRNNSFANFGTGVACYTAFLNYAPFSIDYNNYFSNGPNVVTLDWINSFASPNAGSPTYNANSKGGNPQYLNNLTNLKSLSAQLHNSGQVLASVTDDIDGDIRCPNGGCPGASANPCIGADEYQIPQFNTGVVAVASPTCPITPGLQNVVLTIQNFGAQTLTSANVSYKVGINGAVKTVAWTGSVSTGNTANVTFSGANQHLFNVTAPDTIYSWTVLPNGNADLYTPNDTNISTYAVPLNGTYTVGGASPDFANLTQVAARLSTCAGVIGPVVFNIRTGTYNEQITLGTIPGASATNSITFQAETGVATDVNIQFNATTSLTNHVINFAGANYVKFKNLTVTPLNASFGRALVINANSDFDSFFNVRFVGLTTSSNTTNLALAGAYNSILRYNFWCFDNCQFINGAYGTSFQSDGNGSTASQNLTIKNSTFTNQYAYGIFNQNLNGIRLIGNTITTNSALTSYMGIYTYWITIFTEANRPLILSNTITGALGGHGIYNSYIGVNSSITPGARAIIANNMVQIGNGNTSSYGIRSIDEYGAYYMHNTVRVTSTQSTSASAAMYLERNNTSNPISVVTRNILTGTNGAPALFVTDASSGLPRYNPIDSNLLYSSGVNLAFHGATAYSNLSNWQSGVSRDANSISTLPNFISSTNLRISGPKVMPVPVNSLVTTDIDGNARCFITDIGVYHTAENNDIGISQTIIPNGSVAPAGLQDIVVVLQNFGGNTLTSAEVKYTDGIVTRSVNWTGSLGQCDTAHVRFTGPNQYNFSGTWNLKFFTSLPNTVTDVNFTNDTLTRSGCVGLLGTYTIGGPIGPTNFTSFNAAISAMSCGIAGPVVFNVAAGTYTGQIDIPAINGASAINTVRFVGSGMASCTLTYATSAAVNQYHVLRFNACSFITFDKFTIRSTSSDGWLVHYVNGNNNTLKNSRVEFNVSNPSSSNYLPIVISGATNSNSTQSSLATQHIIDSCEVKDGYTGVHIYMNNGNNPIFVSNTNFNNIYQYGIFAQGNFVPKINKNNFAMCTTPGTTGAQGMSFSNVNPTGVNFTEINNNKITNAGTGIYFWFSPGSQSAYGQIYNNMIGGGFRNSGSRGLDINYSGRYNIYHNNINLDINTTSTTAACLYKQQTSNLNVRNNHFAITATGSTAGVPLFSDLATGFDALDFNNYSNASNNNLLSINNNFVTTSNFAFAFPTGGGASSRNFLPQFVSNLNINSGNACAKGTNLNAITPIDINGITRVNPPNIGANEVLGLLSNDIGVVSVINPALPMTNGLQNVKVVLRNFGANTITTANVSYSINNGALVTAPWTGVMNTCDTIQFTFPVQHNFTGLSFNIKSFSSSPNGVSDVLNGNDTTSVTVCPSMAGAYTVGATGDFLTLSQAISTLACGGMTAPVTLNIQSGTYTDRSLVPFIPGSSSTNTITIQSLSGNVNDVIISSNAANSTQNYVLRFAGGSNFKVRNLTLRTLNASFATAVDVSATSPTDSFFNVKFEGPVVTSTSTNQALVTSTNSSNLINFWCFDACQFINGSYGSYMNSNSSNPSTQNYTIKNSQFVNQYYMGISNNFMNGIRMINNTITTNSAYNQYNGIYNYWILVENDVNKTFITNNKITGAVGGFGIYNFYLGVNSSVTANRRYLIANNMIQIGSGSNTSVGIYVSNEQNSDYIHNTVHLTTSQVSANSAAAWFESAYSSGNNTSVINNNFVASNGAAAIRYGNGTNGLVRFTPANNNNLYTTGSIIGYLGTSSSSDLSTWQGATARDINSVSVDPFFVSNTDLHVAQPALDNVGIVSALVTTDIDGQVRCPNGGCQGATSFPDIGADEFRPLYYDATITAVKAPKIICPGAGATDVYVSMKNLGQNFITSTDIYWSVNGVAQTPYSWSGFLFQGDVDDSFMIGSFNFVSPNSVIKVWNGDLDANLDENNANDTLYFTPASRLNGVYTIGGSTPDFASFADAVTVLNTAGVCGPTTFHVRQGTYTEKLQINTIPGSSATNFVTFKSDPTNTNPVILTDNSSNSAATNHTVFFNGTSFVEFREMTISNTSSSSWSSVLRFAGTQDSIVIRKNILSNNVINSSSTNYAVVNHATSSANMIRRFVLDSNTINGGSMGIYLYGNQSSPGTVAGFEANNRIRHNTFNNQNYYGIYTYLQRNHEIIGNIIDMGSTVDVNSSGIFMVYVDSFKVERNNIRRYGNYGIYGQILNFQFGSGSATSTIVNNMIGGVNSNTNASGIYINPGSTRNINIYHNSVSVNSNQYAIFLQQTSLNQYENIDIRNNSFANYGTGQAAYLYFSTGTPFIVNYNNYFSNGSTFYTLQTNSFSSSQPNGLAPTYNANSKNGDPLYINPINNLYSIGTQLSNAGLNLPSVTIDIDGQTRPLAPSLTVDIGADEYNIPQFDAGIIAIQSPLGICPGGSGPSNVIVTVGNQGTATLTSATVNWSVNGAVQTPFNWTGSLVQNASQANINIGSYTFALSDILKVWTSVPNGNTDQFTFNDTQSNVMNNQLTGTYTIGGSTPDYPNFTAAATALSTVGVCGPVTFNVRQGTYNEKVQINTILGSSATNFVTFRPDPANTTPVILTAAGNTTDNNNHTLFLNGSSFVQFRNMTITNTSAGSWKSVIRFAGVQDSVVIKNNIITANTSSSSGQNEAVINHGTSSFNMINRFVLDSNIINNGSIGVYMVGTSNTTAANFERNNKIRHNTFNNQHYYALFNQFQRNTELIGNFIDMGALTNTNSMGMYLSDLDTFKIERNNIRRFGYYGIYTQGNMNRQFGTGTSVSTIVNNMIGGQNINSNANAIYMSAGNNRNINIYHNSISINSSQFAVFLQQTSSTDYQNINIKNNSFANFGSGSAAYFYFSTGTPFAIDYNNYYSAGTTYYSMFALNNYNSAQPNGGAPTYNANSKNGNPVYINNLTNLHSIAGQLNNSGDNAVSVTLDIDGDARPLSPATTVDIGADEYNMPPDNTSVTAIVSPSCPLSAGLQDVIVNVANYGSVTLTSVDVKYKVGINGTVKTEAWTGSLASGSNMNVTFTGVNQHNFTGSSIDTIIAWTEAPNGGVDFFTGNDTTSGVFYVPLNGTYTVGGASPNFSSLTQVVEALNCAGVSGPVVLNIRNGVYDVNLDLGQIIGSSATNTVTFKSETNNASNVTLTSNLQTYTIRLTNTKNVIFNRLTISKTNSSNTINLVGTNPDSVHNVTFYECNLRNTSSGSGTIIQSSGQTHNIRISRNNFNFAFSGVILSGSTIVSQYNRNIVLDSNNFPTTNAVWGNIQVNYANAPRITNNTCFVGGVGGSIGQGTISLRNAIGNSVVERNNIHSGGLSIALILEDINTVGTGVAQVKNNFITTGGQTDNVTYINRCKNLNFYHNSIYHNSTSAIGLRVNATNVNHNNINIINNNIVVNSNGIPITIDGSSLALATGQIGEINHNNYFALGGTQPIFRLFGTTYNSIASIVGLVKPSSDSASLSVNPSYTNPSATPTANNLRITLLSPVNNKGKELVSVTDDIDVNPRYAIPDIGACEVVNTVRPVVGDLNNPCVNLSGTDWIDIFDGSGNIIYSINPNGNNLGSTCAGVRILASPDADVRKYLIPRYGFYGFLLDRNYYIRPTTQPTTPVSVRFYFLNSELNDMRDKTVADFYNYETNAFNFLRDSMIITKYSGYVNDLNPTDSLDERNYVRGIPFSRVAHYSKTTAYVEFSTPSFSEFTPSYYPTNTLTPLPISITKFEAVKESNNAIVSWSINKDQPVKHYELERSFDGVNFVTIQKYQSTQSQYENGEHNDKNIGLSHSVVFYRLKVVPQSGQNSYSVIKQVVFTNKTDDVIVYPSPTAGVVNITKLGQDNDITYVNVIDVTGKVLIHHQNATDQSNISIDIQHFAPGVYFIEVVNDQKSQKFKIVKQ